MITVIDGIIAGSPIKNIIVKATPAAGKSSLPIIAGKLIPAGLADAICWICPRMTLQDQAERNFIDPFFRDLLRHNLKIRQSTNEVNPCRGLNGFVTTYQAIGVDKCSTVLHEFERRRCILVLDEYHHAEAEAGLWTKALLPLYERAAYRVLMTGTLSRGDKKKVAFTPYTETERGLVPALEGDRETAIIEYTRTDALAENAILPLNFVFADGKAKWEKRNGRVVEYGLSAAAGENARHALYTALRTEYARELLTACINHWKEYRLRNRNAKLLVVSASIKYAKQYASELKAIGMNARIATSDDGPDALKAIKHFKEGKTDILVSVNICYEGLDVPAISHIACLTNIRSAEWIEQMVARSVRIDPKAGPYESQCGYVFAPNDQMFMEIKDKIESDQVAAIEIREKKAKQAGNGNGMLFGEMTPAGITPLNSKMTGQKQVLLNGNGNGCTPELTASEIEADLLDRIESHIRTFAFNNRINPKRLNAEVFIAVGRSRRELTIPELRECLRHVQEKYPINQIRGTGRPRVSTKAQPINCTWRTE